VNEVPSLLQGGTEEAVIALWPYGKQEELAKQTGVKTGVNLENAFLIGAAFGLVWALISFFLVQHLFGRFALILIPILVALPAIGAYFIYRDAAYIRLYRWGFKIQWVFRGKIVKQQQIYWTMLHEVYLTEPEETFFGTRGPRIRFDTKDGTSLDLKPQNLGKKEDWLKFLEAAAEWGEGADSKIDPEILSSFDKDEKRTSYTELWLQSLTTAPERARLQPLPEGTFLDNNTIEVTSQIATGGQGTAYRARFFGLEEQEVVLKEYILPVYVDVKVRRSAFERFMDEAAVLKSLNHPNIVKLVKYFIEDHRAYLVEEYVRGYSVRDLILNNGPVPQNVVVDTALVMVDVLACLHNSIPPVVHRDFTPDNILYDEQGLLKLIDFTVAQRGDASTVGTVVGKQSYLPPEQFRGRATTQSDLYALGGTLYFLLTGKDPEPISQIHIKVEMPQIEDRLSRIIERCTALELTNRYRTAEEIKADLIPLANDLLAGSSQLQNDVPQ